MKNLTNALFIVGVVAILAGLVFKIFNLGGLWLYLPTSPLATLVLGNSCLLVALSLGSLKK